MNQYNPVPDGIPKGLGGVQFQTGSPSKDLKDFVHSYWELRTDSLLESDFVLHVIPDACVNILFNVLDPRIAAITYRKTEYVALNLGKSFHYAGIQLFPGVWNGDQNEIKYGFVDSPYAGKLPLVENGKLLVRKSFPEFETVFSNLVRSFIDKNLIQRNLVTERILSDIDVIESVEDMAASVNLSTRQLQRRLKELTGFSPHDFLKILRLQQTFKSNYLDFFVDQSHFIHSFKKITGYTPKDFFRNFDV